MCLFFLLFFPQLPSAYVSYLFYTSSTARFEFNLRFKILFSTSFTLFSFSPSQVIEANNGTNPNSTLSKTIKRCWQYNSIETYSSTVFQTECAEFKAISAPMLHHTHKHYLNYDWSSILNRKWSLWRVAINVCPIGNCCSESHFETYNVSLYNFECAAI